MGDNTQMPWRQMVHLIKGAYRIVREDGRQYKIWPGIWRKRTGTAFCWRSDAEAVAKNIYHRETGRELQI
jgi:hypothetical protein